MMQQQNFVKFYTHLFDGDFKKSPLMKFYKNIRVINICVTNFIRVINYNNFSLSYTANRTIFTSKPTI